MAVDHRQQRPQTEQTLTHVVVLTVPVVKRSTFFATFPCLTSVQIRKLPSPTQIQIPRA